MGINENDMLVPPKTLRSSSSKTSKEYKVTDKTTPASEESGLKSEATISSSPELSDPSVQGSSPSMIPPAHTMGHPTGYDPNRIPSSVFANKPATPMEWSVASNESLFSIQMGNNSFSRNHVLMLYKSGELSKFDDMINVMNSLPPTPEVDEMNRSENSEKGSQLAGASSYASAETTKVEIDQSAHIKKSENNEAAVNKQDAVYGKSISKRSEGSINSPRSFAFPVLEGGGKMSSVRVNIVEKLKSQKQQQKEQPQQLSQNSETAPKTSAGNSWFSCFSFCKIGCC